ncbi:MAG: ribosome maturation factor RimM [Raineya sp.]|jgi:16S rRNA processing protein RimM|nr:ribosome maturation factor RimM [Raineya sp.]
MAEEKDTYSIDECYELGKIIKPHGLKGEVSIFLDVDYPEDYEDMDSVLVHLNGELVAFEIEQIRILPNKPKTALVKLVTIDKIEQTDDLIGASLYLPLDVLPELGEKEFYYHEVIGFEVMDKKLGFISTIDTVYSFTEGSLLVLEYKGKEVLIPINDETIVKVDRENKVLNVDLPDGLLDVYLS